MKKKNLFSFIVMTLLLSTLLTMFMGNFKGSTAIEEYSSSEFVSVISGDTVKELNLRIENGVYIATGELKDKTKYTAVLPKDDDFITKIDNEASENGVKVTYDQTVNGSAATSALVDLIVIVVGVMALLAIMKKFGPGKGGNNPGKMDPNMEVDLNIKFTDVVGYEEEKQELIEVIDYLVNPDKFNKMGAKIPKGILLEGPPGTGKTLMAKAIAGEAKIPFFSISGSDFIEMYVGVGASRVRDIFEKAKKHESAIIFIDEIDAIGSRDKNKNGGNSEREQTINQMLVELDGFNSKNQSIIIIGATNRADKLDKALLRPGRFDRKILMGVPSNDDRELILKYHANKRKMSEEIDYKAIARQTMGMCGADLESVINEGAILAVRSNRKIVIQEDLVEAIDRVLMGPAKVTNKYSELDKKITSYHESGHAIVGLELDNALSVEKITIVPRRDAAGYVAYTPQEDYSKFKSKKAMFNELVGLLAGRASEETFLDDVTTGAHNDLERATAIARAMVTEYSMTDVFETQLEDEDFKSGHYNKPYSEETAIIIDREIRLIMKNGYDKAIEIVTKRSSDIHKLAKAVREKETLSKKEILEAIQ